jgi:succinate dehydrogenase / fumarate reductase cytochrome b subunit
LHSGLAGVLVVGSFSVLLCSLVFPLFSFPLMSTSPIARLATSSIGRKFLMAITGLVLTVFVFGHTLGTLQIFLPPDHINAYASFLQGLGPGLIAVRVVMLVCVGVHVWAAVVLWKESAVARGPEKYAVRRWLAASTPSRYARLTGLVVLVFIVYHLLHFTVGVVEPGTFKTALGGYTIGHDMSELGLPLAHAGQEVHDVYSMVYLGFSHFWVSAVYVVGVVLLGLHLWHGMESLFQTIGWRNHKWACALRGVVGVLALVYVLCNVAMPVAILSGVAKPAAGTAAAQVLGR